MKKLLALVLALVMVMSLSVVGVSAEFADAADIDHTEAVEVMNSLGIIGGKENNNFDPNGNVKRSEMAKMVTIALLGDVDPAAFAGAASDLTDIEGHWAEGYIKYCVSQGIVGGRGNGLFDPEANVTTVEAAKMLLVALGYNSAVRGYTGSSWTLNVMRDAQTNNLLDELTKSGTNVAMDRDDAAQMIYNTITETSITATETYNSDGTVSTSYAKNGAALMTKTFGGYEEYGYLDTITYDRDKGTYSYDFLGSAPVAAAHPFGGTFSDGKDITAATIHVLSTLKSTEDYSDLFGQKVSVVWKNKDGKSTLLGIYGQGKVIATGVVGQMKDDDKNSLAGTYALAADTSIIIDETTVKLTNSAANTYIIAYDTDGTLAGQISLDQTSGMAALITNRAAIVKAIDNNDDGKADVFVYYPFAVDKVTFVSSNTIVANNTTYTKDTDSGLWKSGGVYYDFPTVAKDDWVKIDTATEDDTVKVTKIEPTQAKVTGEKSSGTALAHQVQIDGSWVYDKTADGAAMSSMLNNTYDFIIANGFFFDADKVSSASTDILLVEGATNSTSLDGSKAKVLFPDGTVDTIYVSKLGEQKTTVAPGIGTKPGDDTLYTYKKASDGTYELTQVSNTNLADNDLFTSTYTFSKATSTQPAKFANYTIDDEATIFVKSTIGTKTTYSVVTGKDLKGYDVTAMDGCALVKGATVRTGYIYTTTYVGTDEIYAYVLDDTYSTRFNDTTMIHAKVWTADGEKEINVTTGGAPMTPKSVVKLTPNTDGSYSAAVAGDLVAITNYDASSKAVSAVYAQGATQAYAVNPSAYAITASTVILNVNNKDNKGISGDTVTAANRDQWNRAFANAYAVFGSDSIKLLVVDVNNNWNDSTNGTIGISVTAPAASAAGTYTALSDAAYKIDIDTYTVSAGTAKNDVYVVAGDVITYTVNWTAHNTGNTVYVYNYSVDDDTALLTPAAVAVGTHSSSTEGSSTFKVQVNLDNGGVIGAAQFCVTDNDASNVPSTANGTKN